MRRLGLSLLAAVIAVVAMCAGAPRPGDRDGDPRGSGSPKAYSDATVESDTGCLALRTILGECGETNECCSGLCDARFSDAGDPQYLCCTNLSEACDEDYDCCGYADGKTCTGGICTAPE